MNCKKKKKKKVLHNNNNKKHRQSIPNNIFTKFFKELIKYKNDYQQYLNYIFQELYYAFYCISLSVSMHMHGITSQLKLNNHETRLTKQFNIFNQL